MSMTWECRKPDLISTLIYMPTPTRHPQTQGTRTQAYACTCTHTHSLLDTDLHSFFPHPSQKENCTQPGGGGGECGRCG